MKKLIILLALVVQTAVVMAGNYQTLLAQASRDNVKMYKQPSTSTEIVRALSTQDRIQVVRKFNANWTIVLVDGQVGYMLHTELTKPRLQAIASAKSDRN